MIRATDIISFFAFLVQIGVKKEEEKNILFGNLLEIMINILFISDVSHFEVQSKILIY